MAKTRKQRNTKRKNRSRRQRGGGFFDSLAGLFGRKTQKVVPGPGPAANAVPRNWANRLAKGKPSTVRSWTWGNKYNTRVPVEAWNTMSANIPYKNYTARKGVYSQAANAARKANEEKARIARNFENFESKLIPYSASLNNEMPTTRPRSLTPTGANRTVKNLRSLYNRPSAFNEALASPKLNANRARRVRYTANALRRYPMI
jgi:hypothetical protein